jgi:low affinity Fe/Cu permease
MRRARRPVTEVFHRFAWHASAKLGNPWAFFAAVALVVGWAFTGPLFGFSDTWQLVINTTTTIITFVMVFLIQATQNRDARAMHLKLDELIRSSRARNMFADLEDATDEELEKLQHEFEEIRRRGERRRKTAGRAGRHA